MRRPRVNRLKHPGPSESAKRFTVFFVEHENYFLRLAHGYTRNVEDARDLVQTAFLRALECKKTFDGRYPKAWFTKIMHVEWMLAYRKSRNTKRLPVAIHADSYTSDPSIAIELTETLERMEDLPKQQRAALLRSVRGDKYREIARSMRTGVGTAKRYIWRAREALTEAG